MSIEERVIIIIRDLFKDPTLNFDPELTAEDVKGWDSLTHVQLIFAIEKEFGIKFRTAEIGKLRNLGNLVEVIAAKSGQ